MSPSSEFPSHSALPVVGVTGYSGSGKTTLVEGVTAKLVRRGLNVSVLKHSVHRLSEGEGKDTDRFSKAGARCVIVHSGETTLTYRSGIQELNEALQDVPRETDVVIVEGYKRASIPKVWMEGPEGTTPPDPSAVVRILKWKDPDNPEHLIRLLEDEMRRIFFARPIMGGILGGGRSQRMGTPKALLHHGNRTFYQCAHDALSSQVVRVTALGAGPYPTPGPEVVVPDAPGVQGPLAGILAAGRWAPGVSWLVCGVDMPAITEDAVEWILGHREPGVWAVMPRIPGTDRVEPLLACYEPMIFPRLEAQAADGNLSLQGLSRHPKVKTPWVPESLISAFTNVNTPEEAVVLERSAAGGAPAPAPPGNESERLPYLHRIQKMEALGRLIPGFIHSLNNEFTTIRCSEKLIESVSRDNPELWPHTRAIGEALDRGVEATRAILSFCQKTGDSEVLNLVERAKKAVTLLRYVVGRRVNIRLDASQEAIPVRGHPEGLFHLLLVVGQHVAGVMPEGGELVMAVDTLADGETGEPLGRISFVVRGQRSTFSPRVFEEALLTTKTGGQDPALTVVRQIVEMHQGRLTVTGERGTGTLVCVCIPLTDFMPFQGGGGNAQSADCG